ncbi:MAG: 1-acyl-sn-glycerol-3-phosphate acyltransferase [Bacteroidaceae bacterium]|nr:1-acyl-sn-glycerol-3-phosphate acyltransferase [Bacteroidaceae bacterium]
MRYEYLPEFDSIRPYNDNELKGALDSLLKDRQLNVILQGAVPWLPRWARNGIIRLAFIGVKSPMDFQLRFMKPIVRYILHKCSTGYSFGHDRIEAGEPRYTFISNHRDIVLDSAILDIMLHDARFPTTCEIAIGDNLLIYPWIETIVKMNKAFTVKRGLSARDLLNSSLTMSKYMHYAINAKHENIWIAQREGRAKDSDDRTQESVLKMLAMGGEGNPVDKLRDMNIVPLTISYEYDPCDYLKATEFQMKRDDPSYKKTPQDDLKNMDTGILGFKGKIHYEASPCINAWLDEYADLPKTEVYKEIAKRMDHEIHLSYRLFPGNYVALDELNGSHDYTDKYTPEEKAAFDQYVEEQLKKVKLENPDWDYLRERIRTMYANPVKNKFKALAAMNRPDSQQDKALDDA